MPAEERVSTKIRRRDAPITDSYQLPPPTFIPPKR
jgi:hypothetical protein